MEPDELSYFKKIFAFVNISNPLSLRKWFESYPELTAAERCQITGRARKTHEAWRRKAGVNGVTFIELDGRIIVREYKMTCPPPSVRPLPKLDIPDDWDINPEWVYYCINDLGLTRNTMSKILKCSFARVASLFAKHCRNIGLYQ